MKNRNGFSITDAIINGIGGNNYINRDKEEQIFKWRLKEMKGIKNRIIDLILLGVPIN